MKDKQEILVIGMPAFRRELLTNVVLVAAMHKAAMMPTCTNKVPEPARLPDIFPPLDLSDIVKPFPRPLNRRERRRAVRLQK